MCADNNSSEPRAHNHEMGKVQLSMKWVKYSDHELGKVLASIKLQTEVPMGTEL